MSRHHGTDRRGIVMLSRRKAHTRVLGPGDRCVVWTAGCELRCRGCIAPETHAHDGERVEVPVLADWVVKQARNLTISGGEPMLQSAAVSAVIDLARERRPELHVMLYIGYRVEWLLRRGSDSQRALLRRVDLLVDGPYVERLHVPLRWRGSSNQRLVDLTERTPGLHDPDDPAGVELELSSDLRLELTGIWPVPGFRQWAESNLEAPPIDPAGSPPSSSGEPGTSENDQEEPAP